MSVTEQPNHTAAAAQEILKGLVADGFDYAALATVYERDVERVRTAIGRQDSFEAVQKMGNMIQQAATVSPDELFRQLGVRLSERFGRDSDEFELHWSLASDYGGGSRFVDRRTQVIGRDVMAFMKVANAG